MFSALFLALNLARPQYTASAPAAIAAFIELISPPGARISNLSSLMLLLPDTIMLI